MHFGARSPEFLWLKAGSKENAVEPSKFEKMVIPGAQIQGYKYTKVLKFAPWCTKHIITDKEEISCIFSEECCRTLQV